MAPAIYNLDTVGQIRGYAANGRSANYVAGRLGWTVDFTLRTARRHDIELRVERSDSDPVGTATVTPSEPMSAAPRKARGGTGRVAALKNHPRNCYMSIAVSAAGEQALRDLGVMADRRPSALAGIALDYLARSGRIGAIVHDALEEMRSA